jgi:hypothetical protein
VAVKILLKNGVAFAGGKNGYREILFGIRNDGKGSERERAANLHELDCVLPKLSGFLPGYLPCYNRDYRIGIIV